MRPGLGIIDTYKKNKVVSYQINLELTDLETSEIVWTDGIDLSMKPVSGGTAQPDIVSMWHALKGTDYDLGLDIEKILETEEIFKECMKDYFLPPEALSVNPMIIQSPLPGGALTANTQMLRDNNLMDKYPEVVAAMKEVVEKGGDVYKRQLL